MREPHASIPRNPLIAEPLYLARYIEKAGSGTLDMIDRCGAAGLPTPDFEERAGQFVTTIWRDWLTAEVISGFDLNERQQKAVAYLKVHGRINNTQYRDLTGVSSRTALRELRQLADIGFLVKVGGTGQAAHYVIAKAQPVIGKQGGNRS